MAFKTDIVSILACIAAGAYLVAFALLLPRRTFARAAGEVAFVVAFAAAVAAFVARWMQVGHLPLQNLFEVFLTMGALLWPLSLLCRRALGARGVAVDGLIGFAFMFAATFVLDAAPKQLPPALRSWLFGPHVGAYMLAYVVLLKAAAEAVLVLGSRSPEGAVASERASWAMATLGLPLLTLGLLLGAWWAKIAWGDYWNWDPKELWSLATWLIYVGYLHYRRLTGASRRGNSPYGAKAVLISSVLTPRHACATALSAASLPWKWNVRCACVIVPFGGKSAAGDDVSSS